MTRIHAMGCLLVAALALPSSSAFGAQSAAQLTPPTTPWTGPRTPDGQPDVRGSYAKDWIGSRGPNFDLEEGQDPEEMRATDRRPEDFPKPQIVRTPDGRIPYQPWAREIRIENRKNAFNPTKFSHLDSNARCLPMGFPRESLDQGPEVIQTPGYVFFEYPYNSVVRTIYLDGRPPLNDRVKLWYGDSRGRWDGNTLIVEGRNLNEHGWYDTYGNFHSADLRIDIAYEYVGALRHIFMNGMPHPHGPIEWWMGDSRGRWEGDTLVVDVVHFNDQTRFDKAGNFHSEMLHVAERYSFVDVTHIKYEVTIDDPKVFTRPWRMEMPLYRRIEPAARVLEYYCYGFSDVFQLSPGR